MSENNRRVIRVKDLVIEAENVIIRPQRKGDRFFGGFREDEGNERYESSSIDNRDHDELDDERKGRGPFSWI
ncbi:hypothetical protein H8S33_10615 [Ornithinibacillus sp. BX22]|uniref:Uncharacterized protein n=1 Tax=Ornithinibacillus hominis TaxID=2763055 RepID=A0A923L6E3_9BACI|nr:hypothetical protein [Ornithinibacillus hominis]MBC5637256.1 hypothetical protein [Ornithinibacillus hominis]